MIVRSFVNTNSGSVAKNKLFLHKLIQFSQKHFHYFMALWLSIKPNTTIDPKTDKLRDDW
jgi:hypothetical protein